MLTGKDFGTDEADVSAVPDTTLLEHAFMQIFPKSPGCIIQIMVSYTCRS
jgi:hypothetical protein